MYKIFLCLLIIIIIVLLYSNRKPSLKKIMELYEENHEIIEEYNKILKQIDYEEDCIININVCKEEHYDEFASLISRTKDSISVFLKWNDILNGYILKDDYYNYIRNKNQLKQITEELKSIRDSLELLKQRMFLNKDYIEKQKLEEEKLLKPNSSSTDYFIGCDTVDDLNKRYKMLVKIYHPDNKTGNIKIFNNIMKEYKEIKRSLKNEK